jgi:hypothetical protein
MLLNLALIALIALAATELRARRERAREREARMLGRAAAAMAAPPEAPPAELAPAQAAAYLDVAEKLLFSRDRNPNVVVEAAPQKEMPALPVAHGVMDFGSGPTVILSPKGGGAQKGYRAGERIGDFTLLEVSPSEVVFDWDGTPVRRALEDLIDRRAVEAAAAAAPAPTQAQPAPPAAPKENVIESPAAKEGPGVDLGAGQRGCVAGDTSPSGTIAGGYRKVIVETLFGKNCRWEKLQ